METIEVLKEKLAKRQNISSTMLCDVSSTLMPGYYKRAGLDFLVMDLEHGAFCPENIGDFLQMCNIEGLPVIIRVQDCEYHCISKPLDMGADGILIPRTETIEQVETAIQSMRFYPLGKKGVGGRALLRPNEKIYDFNKNRLLFLQIESEQGVSLLDEILIKYGEQIAGLLIGPCDMSVSMGCGLDLGCDKVMKQIQKTVSICQKHKKSVGIFMGDNTEIGKWHEQGMNIFWVGSELGVLASATRLNCEMVHNL